MQKHAIHIGTSGWSYKHWINTFYPTELKTKDHFLYYQKHFNTVEINNTFYRLPQKDVFIHWEQTVREDFIFAVKASRFITHMKKLHDPKQSTLLFLEHVRLLKKKLGVILFQLPPNMKCNATLLKNFLKKLPGRHRYVFEFRNADWFREEIYELLEAYNCAFCIYDLEGRLTPLKATADFVYVRLHGPGNKYQGSYSDDALRKWARECKQWSKTKDVFIYFDNDEKAYAAFNAIKLKSLLQT